MQTTIEIICIISLFAAGAIAGLKHGDPAPGYQPIDCRKPYPEECMGDWPEYGEQCND